LRRNGGIAAALPPNSARPKRAASRGLCYGGAAAMSESPTLDRLVAFSPRFARSVSLVRDTHRADALVGYILTPTGREVLRRLADTLRGESATRAWSITGP